MRWPTFDVNKSSQELPRLLFARTSSVIKSRRLASPFGGGFSFLVLQSSKLHSAGHFGFFSGFGFFGYGQNHFSQFVQTVSDISSLIAKPMAGHDKHAFMRDSPGVFLQKTCSHRGGQGFRVFNGPFQNGF